MQVLYLLNISQDTVQSFSLHKHDINLSNYGLWNLSLPSFHYHQRTVRWSQLTANVLVMEFVLNKRPVAYRDKAYCFVRHPLCCTYIPVFLWTPFNSVWTTWNDTDMPWRWVALASSVFTLRKSSVGELCKEMLSLGLRLETSGENSEIADVEWHNCQGWDWTVEAL